MKSIFLKKVAIVAIAVVTMSLAVNAQTPTLDKGDNILGFGIGIGGNLYTGSSYTSKVPAISMHYEYCVLGSLWDDKSSLGVGGMIGYTSAKWEYMSWGWKYSSIIIGARGALHYAFVDKLDTYAGLMVGYNVVTSKAIGTSNDLYKASGSAGCSSFFVGGRYYFTDSFAAFAELGYGIAILNLGISFKF